MKSSHPASVSRVQARRGAGFALVITLSLMVLLTLLGIGLLSLSTISLRAAAQGGAMAVARSNARLALLLAIGELQKSIGPDKAVTATSEIIRANPRKPHLMGVWDSWNYNPNSPDLDYAGKKTELFRRWLVSDKDFAATATRTYVTTGFAGESIPLVTARTGDATPVDSADTITAGKVPIYQNGRNQGAYAWHVSDESVKARINAYRDPAQNQSLWQKRALLAGHRSNPSVVTATDGTLMPTLPSDATPEDYTKARTMAAKLVDLNQVDLLGDSKQIAKFRNHVTLYSVGLPINVREGGLKLDLSSMFGMSAMPSAYNERKLYESTHKISGLSDPYWSALKGYHDVCKETGLNTSTPTYYKAPLESMPLTAATPGTLPSPPKNFYAQPVIAKVEILFSFVVRDSHGPWVAPLKSVDQNMTRMGHLLYAPIITLHNPYNVSLKFDKLDLDIKGIPMAFNFFVNDKPQSQAPVSFNRLFVNGADRNEKSFIISISDWSDFTTTTPTPITMKPGQTLVCGPYINGDTIFGSAGNEGERVFFDYANNLTGRAGTPAKSKPGFLGRQVSYDVDWLTLTEPDVDSGQSTDGRLGILGLRPDDRVYIEYKVQPNTGIIRDKMTVNARLTSQGTTMDSGGLEFDYDDESLKKNFPATYRYPDANSVPNTLMAENLWESNFTPFKTHAKTQSFAMLSIYARTANGGVYDNGTREKINNGQNLQHDGRLAGLPFVHHNPARTPTVVDMKTDPPGRFSHELNVQGLPGNVDDIFNIDATHRGYALTSNKLTRGIKSGSYLELPMGPLQTLADFRRSNALTSALLPNFVQPVANSYASPLMATTSVVQNGIVKYALLDHSVLANHALYDTFYFSTIAPYGSKPVEQVFTDFMEGRHPLVSQAFQPYLPPSTTLAKAKAELFNSGKPGATAYQMAAAYQMIRGAFNVNSTDAQAWKAVLASMSHNSIPILWATSATLTDKPSIQIPILPMSLVNAGAVNSFKPANAANIDNKLTNDWNGYQELTPQQLEALADKIVDQVRRRGPFLSMSEFVNRRVGADSELTRAGALQAAIDNAKLNKNLFTGAVTDIRLQDVSDETLYKFLTPAAATGNPAAGAPGWIMQGDLLRILEPGATVRADTFVIRVCGEACDATGRVTARAYAEAVVQRTPEYLNSIDKSSVNVWDPKLKSSNNENKRFGRRLNLLAFRWLAESEI
jgi:hypothetical protein